MNPMCTLNSDWIQAATPNDSLRGGGLDTFHASSNCTTTLSNAALVLEALETVLCLAKARMNLQVAALQASGVKTSLPAEGEAT